MKLNGLKSEVSYLMLDFKVNGKVHNDLIGMVRIGGMIDIRKVYFNFEIGVLVLKGFDPTISC